MKTLTIILNWIKVKLVFYFCFLVSGPNAGYAAAGHESRDVSRPINRDFILFYLFEYIYILAVYRGPRAVLFNETAVPDAGHKYIRIAFTPRYTPIEDNTQLIE